MNYIAAALLGLLFLSTAQAEPVREIEVTSTPPENGQQTFDVRFTPGESATYEKVTFECVLQQQFVDETTYQTSGVKKIHEPAVFTYRRKDVKMVEDLDAHISFRVPISHDRLQEVFGLTTFNTNCAVTVARMAISATGPSSWTAEIPASGVHRPPFSAKPPLAPKPFRP